MVDFNVMEHELVPEHYLLKDEEAEKLLKELNITRDQLPKIRATDPCVQLLERKYGHIKDGSIIKIVRKSDIAGMSIAYRVVVSYYGLEDEEYLEEYDIS